MPADFFGSLKHVTEMVNTYLFDPRFENTFQPRDLSDAVFSYLRRPAKRLRPAVLLWACGAVGGSEANALPAACAVELFHTWTLVHDDIIDNDSTRRGGPTVHTIGTAYASEKLGYDGQSAEEYGRDLAILTGDCQHGWNVALLCECAKSGKVDPNVILTIIAYLESHVVNTLLEGELLDVQYERMPIEKLTDTDILRMLWAKTGALYEFAARAGAMIGLNTADHSNPMVCAISEFASQCGTAFQLQDDILGLTADQTKLGKPVGSDIREGKKTLLVYYALAAASANQRDTLMRILGNSQASDAEVAEAITLIAGLGAIEKTSELALGKIESAMTSISQIPDSEYKELLLAWADFMINRAW